MSHFITNTKNLQNQPLFDLATRDIVAPNIKKYIKTHPNEKNKSNRKQSFFLNTICKRLEREEFDVIHQQNAKQMASKFKKMKKKLHQNMQRQSVQKIFNSTVQSSKLDIRALVKMHPQRVQLQKKYGNHILMKMQTFKQAEQISSIKQKYFKWYDDSRNDRCNSPIFNKMTYLLQRTQKQNTFNTFNTSSQKINIYTRIARHTTKQIGSPLPKISNQKFQQNNSYINRQHQLCKQKQKFSIYR